MRVKALLLTAVLAAGAYAAEAPEPLSLEFLEFLELLGDDSEQEEMVELFIAAEGGSDSGLPEAAGANDDE